MRAENICIPSTFATLGCDYCISKSTCDITKVLEQKMKLFSWSLFEFTQFAKSTKNERATGRGKNLDFSLFSTELFQMENCLPNGIEVFQIEFMYCIPYRFSCKLSVYKVRRKAVTCRVFLFLVPFPILLMGASKMQDADPAADPPESKFVQFMHKTVDYLAETA